ncbi:uncharacterized protein EI90DRAFT_3140792 [Cantharellus anzutake]|uniref:uncharacterized protein n=1 Tax=Cantharellus anzutake TaxID=1750568 RepID=UPI0019072B22|nr:uncharacterized protein EI90DRAFT_3140792 [Cantharellus anzutake]KAF8309317.1 hypothetical protein EI90DRAFT_3140792 [Cantharellus anzutake]
MPKSKGKARRVNTNFVNDTLNTTKSGLIARKTAWRRFQDAQSSILKAVSSLIDEIRNDVDLTGNDAWNVGLDETATDYSSLDMTYEDLADVVALLQPKQRSRGISWRNRINASQAHWAALIPSLSDIYLKFKTSNPQCTPLHSREPPEGSDFVYIYAVDIFDSRSYEYMPRDPGEASPTFALLCAGYIPATPINPTVAISICSLELLHCLMRTSPSFSIQSFTRLLADLHCVVYQPYLRTQVSLAFEAYYAIITRVNAFVKHVMAHDTPDYRLKNSCPACHYKLHDEPKLSETMFEGIAGSGAEYGGTGPSDPLPESCIGWKNSRPMAQTTKAGSLGVMDETGIFLIICRHGIVQFVMDMVKSGELAKYPVAAANKLISTFGHNILFAYDVGCTFSVTLARSAIGDVAHQANFLCCTGSFHGVAHSRLCQLDHLIGLKEGVGIEDGEGNERAFSSSNGVAAVTRHASVHYRHFRIHLHFEKWDQDKYERLGNFLLGNHTSAWMQIRESMGVLEAMKHMHPSFDFDRDCPLFLREEKEYIASLRSEPKAEQAKIKYLEALERLENAELELRPLLSMLSASPTSELAYQASRAQRKVEDARCIVSALEATSSLTLPWLANSPQRQEAIQLRNERKYHRLLDDLEHRAISRQFELEKMGLPKTDYKTRQRISQLIGKRSRTLHSTLEKYNTAAAAMIPPKPSLTWDDITHPDFPSTVELLRGRDDIRSCEWAQEHFRAATRAWASLQRAKEELVTIGVETRRILTSMRDEELQLKVTIEAMAASNPTLASYISMAFKWRVEANAHLRKKLSRLESHPYYRSPCGTGTSARSEWVPPSNSDDNQQLSVEPNLPSGNETADGGNGGNVDDGLSEEEGEEQSQYAIDKLVDLLNSTVIT